MPTVKPRYTFTDTGSLGEMLDDAQRYWPEIADRKALMLRLVEEGRDALDLADAERNGEQRRDRIRRALDRIPSLVESTVLLSDDMWPR